MLHLFHLPTRRCWPLPCSLKALLNFVWLADLVNIFMTTVVRVKINSGLKAPFIPVHSSQKVLAPTKPAGAGGVNWLVFQLFKFCCALLGLPAEASLQAPWYSSLARQKVLAPTLQPEGAA